MAKQLRKKKPPKDINQLAAFIVEQTTKESPNPPSRKSQQGQKS
jgi:hypothetical protein